MKLYRIGRQKYIDDLRGIGAELYGGRWNSIGKKMLYTASTSSLTILEALVHFDADIIPDDYMMLELEIPDTVKYKLFKNIEKVRFNKFPADDYTQSLGDEFLKENKFLLYKVPSIISRREFNFLLNPLHSEMSKVKTLSIEPFVFDNRLLKNK